MLEIGKKICTKCKQIYPETTEYFYKCFALDCGLNSWCKKCCIAYQKTYSQTDNGREANRRAQRKHQALYDYDPLVWPKNHKKQK